MHITDVKLYTVDTTGSDYRPGQREQRNSLGGIAGGEGNVSANPMSIFPKYKYKRVSFYRLFGPAAYAPFVVELTTDVGVSGFAIDHGGGEIAARIVRDHFRQLSYVAMSAVDLALWDLKVKLLERPVFDLICGRTRDTIECSSLRSL